MVLPVSTLHTTTRFLGTNHGCAHPSGYEDTATASVEPILPEVRFSHETMSFLLLCQYPQFITPSLDLLLENPYTLLKKTLSLRMSA